MLLSLRVLIAKIDRKVLPYFSFPAARIFASMPKLIIIIIIIERLKLQMLIYINYTRLKCYRIC